MPSDPTRQALLLAACLLAIPTLLPAQRPGGMRPPGDLAVLLDPVLINGPATPEEMIDIVSLEASQYERYATDYRAFMAETQPVRDSIAELRAALRDRFTRGSPPEERRTVRPTPGGADDPVRDLLKRMEERQKAFDRALKEFLTDPQMKRYESWREEGRRRAMEDMGIPRGRPAGP